MWHLPSRVYYGSMTFQLAESIALLKRTPALLDAWLRGLPDAWTRSNEGPGTWSPFDIVGHLIHGEQTDWIPRTKQILAGGDAATFAPFDRQGHESRCADRGLEELLDEFAECRAESLHELRNLNLGAADLERCGIHPEFGSVRLEQHLAAWTVHDLAHLAQASRAMARHYRGAVGPWSQYLSIVG